MATDAFTQEQREEIFAQTISEILTSRRKQQEAIEGLTQTGNILKSYADALRGTTRELLWAHIFSDTVAQSVWLKQRNFSPGRWAVGYPFLYALYRILDEMRPKSILECGLGQSTKMISQYAAFFPDVRHIVVEHDETWIDFFSRSYRLPESTNLCVLPLIQNAVYGDDDAVTAYEGFQEKFQGCKFDFLCIDGPFGGQTKKYARVDVLSLFPQCLEKSFAVFLDDAHRTGETNTLIEMRKSLDAQAIPYAEGKYQGEKVSHLLVSRDLRFLTSM